MLAPDNTRGLHALFTALLLLTWSAAIGQPFDSNRALEGSRAAIGNQLPDLVFLDINSRPVRLSDFSGKPVLVSLIYTSCHHTCPMVTQHLKDMVARARARLGDDSFHVLTVGFDVHNDSPQAMKSFRRKQTVSDPNWRFLSGDKPTINRLSEDLGFIYRQSPRGFDHLVQLSLIDGNGRVAAQVHGARFEIPALMEPLKRLVYGGHAASDGLVANLVNRVKLFCTIYNPNTGRYMFDYSLFIQMGVGGMIILGVFWFLIRERRRSRQC